MDDQERTALASERHAAVGGMQDVHTADAAAPANRAAPMGANRRQLLVRGVGVLGALLGGAVLGRTEPAEAAAPLTSVGTTPVAAAQQKHLALRITLAPLQTRHAVWADHEWDFGAHFTGAEPPVVVATALDDYMAYDPAASCTCAVAVHGTPGAYRATLMVRHVSPRAQSVVINAVAIGT